MTLKRKQAHEMFFANSVFENGFVNTSVLWLDICEGLKQTWFDDAGQLRCFCSLYILSYTYPVEALSMLK